MKKVILIGTGLFLLVVGYQALNLFVLNPPEEPKPVVIKKKKVEPWDGTEVKFINASVTLKRADFIIIKTGFSGLNNNKANVKITIQTEAINGRVPKWMTRKQSFKGRFVNKTYIPAAIDKKVQANIATVGVLFLDIPTSSLGKTCKQAERSDIRFMVDFIYPSPPRQIFSIEPAAPKPPKDHCLAEAGSNNIKPKVNISRIKLQKQPNSTLVAISGFAVVPGNRVYVWVNNKRVAGSKVNSAKRFIARFRIAKPKGSVLVRIGTKDQPGLARKKTDLVK